MIDHPAPERALPVAQIHLAFEASHELSQLATHLIRLVDAANLDEGVLWRGMLARMKQLAVSISACVDEDPAGSYEMPLEKLTELIIGDADAGRELLRVVERSR